MAKQSRAIEVTEHDNKCPECLHLEISGEPVASESKGPFSLFKKSEPEAFSLSVRINFNEQWLVFSFGRVKFGLRGGELRLKLENGQMPSELRNEALKKILARELEIERQSGGEQESKSQVEASVTPDLSKASLKGVGEQRQKKSQVDKFQLKIAQISHKGANNQPVWVFENRTGEPVLIGELADSLGKMLIAGVPWSVEATFTPEMRQVVITGLENLFKDDISGHKLNVFELAVAKLFLKHKTQPYLSRQVLRYE
ncbi:MULTISPECIES: hypothetical protein [unclassified Microcystis]|uniref:hypothetical protein n=1 Tax=unclassified Microcystis TaxID=2643300 RepID=UPI002582F17A|nr:MULTISPECIES: hypothetical protein [unclassified Microcystis]MCA2671301.1 hypothetical protein [Microcystis sp. M080S2]MCA2735162.1 hypothetical protein [Microcystis sp. M158S2]MCA2740691.1 hypothetical protein [Microcystis sp. M165S2]MCA2761920.1 hypothetical protein [Microcystis sp. M151S2]MCA2642570.1 hypothetical protein [Microcystis sp. M087S2]